MQFSDSRLKMFYLFGRENYHHKNKKNANTQKSVCATKARTYILIAVLQA